MGRGIEVAVWRTATHLPPGTDLRHEWLQNSTVPVQPQCALLDPLTVTRDANDVPPRGSKPSITMEDHPEFPTPSPECEGLHDDLAALALGALDEDEMHRLLDHLDGCPHCTALREDYSDVARALETLIPPRMCSPGFTNRIMALIRSPKGPPPKLVPFANAPVASFESRPPVFTTSSVDEQPRSSRTF
jgi:hypothetical protein